MWILSPTRYVTSQESFPSWLQCTQSCCFYYFLLIGCRDWHVHLVFTSATHNNTVKPRSINPIWRTRARFIAAPLSSHRIGHCNPSSVLRAARPVAPHHGYLMESPAACALDYNFVCVIAIRSTAIRDTHTLWSTRPVTWGTR